MKQRPLASLCIVLALSVLLFSCGSAGKDALPVPKDAAFVLHLNTKSLSSKLSWDEIKQTNWFREGQSNATDSLAQQLMNNPESSGIDTKDEIVLFVKRVNSNEGFAVVAGRLKDAAAFEAFNKKMSKTNASAVKEGDVTSMSVDKKVLASWSGNKFMYVIDINTPKFDWNRGMPDVQVDSNGNVIEPEADYLPEEKPADLKGYTATLFKLKGDSMLVNDDRYSDLIKKDGDVHLWMSAEHAYGGSLPFGVLSMLKLEKYFKESVTTATLNFENGRITMDAKSFSNDEMTALLKKYQASNINTNLLERIPSDSVAAVFAMSYPPEGLREFIKLGGLDGMINSFLSEVGITLDDFIAANKGEMVIALTDFTVKERIVEPGEGMEPYRTSGPDAQVLFVNAIGNKAQFDKLVNLGKQFGDRMNSGDKQSIFYNMNNELFVAGSSQQLVDQYLQGGNRNPAYIAKIKGHPFGAYIDIRKFISGIGATARDSAAQQSVQTSLNFWEDLVISGGEFNNGGIEQHVVVNLVDKNTNSLKQLNQYIDKMNSAPKRGF